MNTRPHQSGPSAFAAAPWPQGATIPLSELLGSLSFALDLTEGQPPGHCVRACWIALAIAKRIGLSRAATQDLYYTVLLKDLGCSNNASLLSRLYVTDDLTFKHGYKTVNGMPQALAFVLRNAGVSLPLAKRSEHLFRVLRHGTTFARELIETRCHRGAEIARGMRFSEAVADAIQALDEHWDGTGLPLGLSGTAIPLHARIALLAQVADVFLISAGPKAARAEIRRRSGSWFDPTLARALEEAAAQPGFWDLLKAPDLPHRLFALEPAQHATMVDEDLMDDIAHGFAAVIDAKSPFTAGHSDRVASLADAIAEELGCNAEHRRWLRRMALLHDIGKLGVSNIILDKPGLLDSEERSIMERHAVYTAEILGRISAFAALAPVAAAHHERLDGKGYPLGLKGGQIAFETRILTVADIFDALTADRPYRKALPVAQALDILDQGAGTVVDAQCVAALKACIAEPPRTPTLTERRG
ncbi:HD domain-containing phosphohydrolase [Xanthobacter sp. DSM 24535]|uniref:HD-GYP domain-containing protein n=1 Tax=Roseixanthobacter psychrophilus TaxID=3119917 RepID=UPI00372950E0